MIDGQIDIEDIYQRLRVHRLIDREKEIERQREETEKQRDRDIVSQ